MTQKEFIRIEGARGTIFNIFSALFCQPEEEFTFSDKLYTTLRILLEIVNPKCVELVESVKKCALKSNATELLVNYTRIFLGPFTIPVPPYSSIHFGSSQLMSDETVWTSRFYRKMGLKFDEKIRDLPDHFVVETEFMYYLVFHELLNLKEKKKEEAKKIWSGQNEFYTIHYKKWVPKFSKQLIEKAENEYYEALGRCFLGFIESDSIPEFPERKKTK